MENRRRIALRFAPPGLEPEFASRRHEDQSRRFPGERWIAPGQFARYRVSRRPENGSGRLGKYGRREVGKGDRSLVRSERKQTFSRSLSVSFRYTRVTCPLFPIRSYCLA